MDLISPGFDQKLFPELQRLPGVLLFHFLVCLDRAQQLSDCDDGLNASKKLSLNAISKSMF